MYVTSIFQIGAGNVEELDDFQHHLASSTGMSVVAFTTENGYFIAIETEEPLDDSIAAAILAMDEVITDASQDEEAIEGFQSAEEAILLHRLTHVRNLPVFSTHPKVSHGAPLPRRHTDE